MNFTIPIYQPWLAGNEKKYVLDCLDTTWISSKGKFISQFEEKFAEYIGVSHAASVCNGTVALHVALVALGIGPGDEVIVPTLTYIASVNAIAYTGATPVFVDSLNDTWQMNPKEVKKKLTGKTRAILAVHLYGHPCDMDALHTIAKDNNLFLIEDCAESIGAKFNGENTGTFGDLAVFSFFGNKTITTGEGGMVVTNDENLHNKVVHFKGQGLAKNREYWHDVIGFNYRMTNICAAIGLAQLEQVDFLFNRKLEIAALYKKSFQDTKISFHQAHPNVLHAYWMCSILVPEANQRESLRAYLKLNGIETRPLFYPIHTMDMYKERNVYTVAEDIAARGINLPSFPQLTNGQVEKIASLVLEYIG